MAIKRFTLEGNEYAEIYICSREVDGGMISRDKDGNYHPYEYGKYKLYQEDIDKLASKEDLEAIYNSDEFPDCTKCLHIGIFNENGERQLYDTFE